MVAWQFTDGPSCLERCQTTTGDLLQAVADLLSALCAVDEHCDIPVPALAIMADDLVCQRAKLVSLSKAHDEGHSVPQSILNFAWPSLHWGLADRWG